MIQTKFANNQKSLFLTYIDNLAVLFKMVLYVIPALLHEPFWGGGCAADPYRDGSFKLTEIYILFSFNKVRPGVYVQTFVEQHLAVGTLAARYEQYHAVAAGELAYVLAAV